MSALPNILQRGCGKLQEPGLYSHLLPPALGTVAVVAEKRNWRHLDSLQNQVEFDSIGSKIGIGPVLQEIQLQSLNQIV